MRSIPMALTWELLSRGRWSLPTYALGANVFPAVILAALRHEGLVLDPSEPSLIIMHVVVTQINMFIFGAALLTAQGSPTRLSAYPVTSATLATWHMLPVMVGMALQSVLSTAFLNAAFQTDWPIWGPALFAAVAVAGIQAIAWLTEKSGWVVWGFTLVGAVLGLWFKSRHGPMFSPPIQLWRHVTPSEVVALAAMGICAYFIAVLAISRNRCGERLPVLGIVAWLERLLDPAPRPGLPFRGPAEGQLWFEWRKKGWSMPAVVLFGMFLGVLGWSLFSRDPAHLLEGFVAGGGLLAAGGLVVGIMLGNCGKDDSSFDIGQFLATRPMTTVDLARTILKTAAKSVLFGWAIWAAAFALLYLLLIPTGLIAPPEAIRNLQWWYIPATLVGPWTVVVIVTSLGLIGNSPLLVKCFFWLVAVSILLSMFAQLALSKAARLQFWGGCAIAVGVILVLTAAWLQFAARRRGLVELRTVAVASAAWLTLSAGVVAHCYFSRSTPWSVVTLMVGALALSASPFAAAPLALARNRNR